MKVAHLTTVDLSLRFLVLAQLEAVIDSGGEAIGISAPGPWVGELEKRGIRHVPLPSSTRGWNPLADLRSAVELWRVLRREKPDVLHTHNPKPGVYGRILGRLAGVPIVVNTVHGLYATPDDPLPKRLAVYLLEAIASRFSDAELVQNPEDLELLLRLHLVPRSHTRLLGNGVDLGRFNPSRFDSSHRRRVRDEWKVRDDQLVAGIVGRLVAEKGYPELFEAVESLDDSFVLVCIGPADPDKTDGLPRDMVRRAEAVGARFLGMRPDVDTFYPAMDLFVLPSHREGFPRAAMEAAAMGLPMVATDIRGCRQVVSDGLNGLLVPVRSPGALASAIRRLGEEPELRQKMGMESRRLAEERFDETRVVEIVMETYRRLALEKGLFDLVNEPPSDSEATIRAADPADAVACARLHAATIMTGFLPRLGHRFLTHLYRSLIDSDRCVVLMAELDGLAVGFVAGTVDTDAFYRRFLLRDGLRAALAAAPHLARQGNLRRVWETLRYTDQTDTVPAELLAMGVAPGARRRGLGRRLGEDLLGFLRRMGARQVRVVVASDNQPAIAAYQKMGFRPHGQIEVHAGEQSVVMLWTA